MPTPRRIRSLTLLAAALAGAPAGAAALPATASAASHCRGATTPVTALSVARVRSATLCALNAQRRAAGLPRLRAVGSLMRSAQRHTRAMVYDHVMTHGDLAARVRAYTAGHTFSVGENVGTSTGRITVARMVRDWMRSPPHRANILQPRFRDVGIGVVRRSTVGTRGATFTTNFGWRG